MPSGRAWRRCGVREAGRGKREGVRGNRGSRGWVSVAEREGFEPSLRLLTVNRFSKPAPSATRPPLRNRRRRMEPWTTPQRQGSGTEFIKWRRAWRTRGRSHPDMRRAVTHGGHGDVPCGIQRNALTRGLGVAGETPAKPSGGPNRWSCVSWRWLGGAPWFAARGFRPWRRDLKPRHCGVLASNCRPGMAGVPASGASPTPFAGRVHGVPVAPGRPCYRRRTRSTTSSSAAAEYLARGRVRASSSRRSWPTLWSV